MWTTGQTTRTADGAPRPDRGELEQLLAGVARGDREALAALYRETRSAVYAVALACLKNDAEAQDVTQDTYVQVWKCAGQYRAQGTPLAWLLAVARNLSRMHLRARTRQVELDEEGWAALPAPERGLSPEGSLTLRGALEELKDTERQVILLHTAAGLKHREIAALLELPLSTVLSQYHRALKKLRTKMEGGDVL